MKPMNSSAAVAVIAAISSWLEVLEVWFRVLGSIAAFVASVLVIVIHIRTIRKGKDKQ